MRCARKPLATLGLLSTAAVLLSALLLSLAFGTASAQQPAADPPQAEWIVEAQGGDFTAVSMVSPTEGWAMTAGQPNRFYHYNGAAWVQTALAITTESRFLPVNDFIMTSATTGWAVGRSLTRDPSDEYYFGRIWRLQDGVWTQFTLTPTATLTRIKSVGANAGYAYGPQVVYYYHGETWRRQLSFLNDGYPQVIAADGLADGSRTWVAFEAQPFPGSQPRLADTEPGHDMVLAHQLNDLDVISPTHGWAAGDSGYVLRFNGTTWISVTTPATANDTLMQVQVVAVDNVFITGYNERNEDFVLHFDGATWTRTSSPLTGQFADLDMLDAADGWIVTRNGGVLRWNGTTWQDQTAAVVPPPADSTIVELEMISQTFGAAVTGDAILMFDGQRWQPARLPNRQAAIQALDLLSASFGVAGGAIDDYYRFWQWEGEDWRSVDPTYDHRFNADTIRAISLVDRNDGWAAGFVDLNDGYGSLLRFDGVTWNEVFTLPEGQWPRDILMTSATDGWLVYHSVAENRDGLQRFNGTTWEYNNLTIGECQAISSLVARAPDDVWAVGSYQTGCNSASPQPRTGALLHFDGVTWSSQPTPNNVLANGIALLDNNEMWVVGPAGAIYRYDFSIPAWTKQSSPVTLNLLGISMLDSTHGRIWAEDGTILALPAPEQGPAFSLYLPAVRR